MPSKNRIAYALKGVLSAGILAILIANVDRAAVGARMANLDYAWVAPMVALLLLQLILSAGRWHVVARALDIAVTLKRTLVVTFVGACFNQILPTTVGGDVVKAWMINRSAERLGRVVMSLLLDRALGLASLLLLVQMVLWLPGTDAVTAEIRIPVLALSAAGAVAALALLAVSRLSTRVFHGRRLGAALWAVIDGFTALATRPRYALPALALAVLIHLISVAAAWCAARAVGGDVAVFALVICLPLALVIATAPISIGGWGVREGALVFLLDRYGVPADVAVALSVVFGLGLIVASLPGSVAWFVTHDGTAPPVTAAADAKPHLSN